MKKARNPSTAIEKPHLSLGKRGFNVRPWYPSAKGYPKRRNCRKPEIATGTLQHPMPQNQ